MRRQPAAPLAVFPEAAMIRLLEEVGARMVVQSGIDPAAPNPLLTAAYVSPRRYAVDARKIYYERFHQVHRFLRMCVLTTIIDIITVRSAHLSPNLWYPIMREDNRNLR